MELLSTEEGRRLRMAKAVYYANAESVGKFDVYRAYREKLQADVNSGAVEGDELKAAVGKLDRLTEELTSDAVFSELGDAETEFYDLVNSVLDVVKATVTGEVESCGGNCASCGSSCGRK